MRIDGLVSGESDISGSGKSWTMSREEFLCARVSVSSSISSSE